MERMCVGCRRRKNEEAFSQQQALPQREMEFLCIECFKLKHPAPTPRTIHPSAIWAREILARPNVVILDTETTGFRLIDEIIEIAIISTQNTVLLNRFFQCQMATIPPEATRVHGITKRDLHGACTFPQVWNALTKRLATWEILIYNVSFDVRMLKQAAERYGLALPTLHTQCLMARVSAYMGGQKQVYKLSEACSYFRIEQSSAHRALADVQNSLKVLQALAARA